MKKQIQGLTKLVTEFSNTVQMQAKSKDEIEDQLMGELLRGGKLLEDTTDIVIEDKTDLKEIQKMVEILKNKQGLTVWRIRPGHIRIKLVERSHPSSHYLKPQVLGAVK